MLLSVMICNSIMNRLQGYENSRASFDFKRWVKSVVDGRYALLVPVIILGGIYSGIFTPTESAAVAALTTTVIGFWQGTLKISQSPKFSKPQPRSAASSCRSSP